MSLAYKAMMFAREAHKDQVRKYTANPYVDWQRWLGSWPR
jgi:guanosine-3',5'-bis(diphosphate) 3'-pyrophosphohydrolase